MALGVVVVAKVNSQAFVGIMWGGTALSLCFLNFRVFVHLRYFRRLYADDFFVVAAWIMLLASSIMWQTQQTHLYNSFKLSAGQLQPTAGILAAEQSLMHGNLGALILFLSCLWSVKVSIMLLFHRLGYKVRIQKIWWWSVMGFTILTWATCIGVLQYWCLLGSADYIITHCGASYQQSFTRKTFYYHAIADVLTDAMILSIPISMLWNVGISLKQKLALMSLFSLTIIATVVAILRVSMVSSSKHQVDTTWLYTWSNIDMAVAIIVACLASFRQLFVKSEQANIGRQSRSSYLCGGGLLLHFRSLKSRMTSGGKRLLSQESDIERGIISSQKSTEFAIPIDPIHIRRGVKISTDIMGHDMQEVKANRHDSLDLPAPSISHKL